MDKKTILSSDTGMMLLLLNVCGILWYSAIKGHPVPDGMVTIVLGIWGAKTLHGIATN